MAAFMPEATGFEEVCGPSELQRFSVSNSERFWAAAARQRLSWISPFHTVQDCDLSQGRIKWFDGGKLNVSGEISSPTFMRDYIPLENPVKNDLRRIVLTWCLTFVHLSGFSVNCLDRHVHTCPEKVALIWEKDEPGSEVRVTYR